MRVRPQQEMIKMGEKRRTIALERQLNKTNQQLLEIIKINKEVLKSWKKENKQ